jgi:hypothetical protein
MFFGEPVGLPPIEGANSKTVGMNLLTHTQLFPYTALAVGAGQSSFEDCEKKFFNAPKERR